MWPEEDYQRLVDHPTSYKQPPHPCAEQVKVLAYLITTSYPEIENVNHVFNSQWLFIETLVIFLHDNHTNLSMQKLQKGLSWH